MKRISRILFFLLIIVVSFLCFNDARAISSDVYLVMTNPAEDCNTSINISYHSTIQGTFIEYTKKEDTSYSNKKIVYPVEEKVTIFDGTSGANVTDYVLHATIEGLESSCEYMYRVGKNTMTKNYYFRTGGTDYFSFAVISDFHTYSKIANRLNTANEIVSNIKQTAMNFSFVMSVGDNMAYGTNRGYWEDLTNTSLISESMFASTPGNHDYYNPQAKFLDSSYFNNYTNNPKNGPKGLENTTYYFYYSNTLFISLNSEDACTNNTKKQLQREWLEDVLKNNSKTFIVVFFHRGMYPGSGSNEGHATTMKNAYQDLFDKYGVDLVFGGHDHVYVRTTSIFEGKESTTKAGTTYINLPQIGDRASNANSNMTNILKKIGGISGGLKVKINNTSIELQLYDEKNKMLDRTTIYSKLYEFKINDYMNKSIEINYDETFDKMYYNYNNSIFQKAYKVEVLDKDNIVLSFIPLKDSKKMAINNVSLNDYKKDYLVKVYFRDGTIKEKKYSITNNEFDFGKLENIRLDGDSIVWDNQIKDVVKEIVVVDNDKETILDSSAKEYQVLNSFYHKNFVTIKVISFNEEVLKEYTTSYGCEYSDIIFTNNLDVYNGFNTDIIITNNYNLDLSYEYEFDPNFLTIYNNKIKGNKSGKTSLTVKCVELDITFTIEVNILERKSYNIKYILDGGILENAIDSYLEFDDVKLKEPQKKGYTFSGWYLDKDFLKSFNGEFTNDLVLYAKWEKVSGCNSFTSVMHLYLLLLGFVIIKKRFK